LSQQISENKIRQRWSKYSPCFFKILQTRGGITSAIHRHPHRKKFSSHRHCHRKKLFCNRHRHRHRKKIFLSPSPSPKKIFLVTITVTVTVNKSFCHRHRNRWAVTVTTVFSPPVTCHRWSLNIMLKVMIQMHVFLELLFSLDCHFGSFYLKNQA